MKFKDFCEEFNFDVELKNINDNSYLIYFFLLGDKIRYIGKSPSESFFSLLSSHRKDKVFDSYFFIDSIQDEETAGKLESAFISLVNPELNYSANKINIPSIRFLMSYMKKRSKRFDSNSECRECGSDISHRTKRAKYCSDSCRKKYHEKKST